MPTLASDRAKLNPHFEAYKLSPADEDVAARIAHHAGVIAPVSGRAPYLGLAQARTRAARNHLAVAPAADRALFVDADRRVVLVSVDDAGVPETRVVYTLPDALSSASALLDPELPCIMAASDSTWLLSDGHGALLALHIPPAGEAALLVTYDIVSPETGEPLPFVIHAAAAPSADTALALIVSSARIPKAERTPSGPSTSFTAALLSFSLSSPIQPSTVWSGYSTDAPSHVTYHAPQNAFLLLSPAPFKPTLVPEPPVPTADDLAPVPRADEALDGPPYQWTQTPDSVTITIAFPPVPALRASAFAIALTPTHVSVSLAGTPVLPRVALWDGAADSTWTFDPAAHVLALELDKAHTGTRWPRLFAAGTDVPETLDAAQLAGIRAALDKHTADADALGGPVPSLARGEIDDELDTDGASSAHLLWLPTSPGRPTPANDTTPVALLGTALPGALAPDAPPFLLAKAGLDGLLFAADDSGTWAHAATFPALAFVLASKRAAPASHIFHAGARAALAFEPGDPARGAGNLYFYRGEPGRAPYGRQTIVRVGAGGDGGMLVGVGTLVAPGGRRVLLALCEREVVVLRGLLE